MTAFLRADYGRNPHEGASRNNAAARGWGAGWPSCQGAKMATASGGGVRVSVRREVVELVETLLDATAAMGYTLKVGQCWGFACRPIRGSSTPSNHSWGLAVDVNSETNPMQSSFRSDIPPAVARIWEASGFYWGGRYLNRPDAMHFEYLGRPDDVAADLVKAKGFLAAARGEVVKPATPPKKQPATAAAHEPGSRTLSKGDRGTDVAFLQRWLSHDLVDDGIFGPKTEAVVKRYQRMRGLEQDGVVGPITWRNILGK